MSNFSCKKWSNITKNTSKARWFLANRKDKSFVIPTVLCSALPYIENNKIEKNKRIKKCTCALVGIMTIKWKKNNQFHCHKHQYKIIFTTSGNNNFLPDTAQKKSILERFRVNLLIEKIIIRMGQKYIEIIISLLDFMEEEFRRVMK